MMILLCIFLLSLLSTGARNQPRPRNTHTSHWPVSLNAGQEWNLLPRTVITAPKTISSPRIRSHRRPKAV